MNALRYTSKEVIYQDLKVLTYNRRRNQKDSQELLQKCFDTLKTHVKKYSSGTKKLLLT